MRLINVIVINPREQTVKKKTVASCFAGIRSSIRKLYGVTDLTQTVLDLGPGSKVCALHVSGLALAMLAQEIDGIELPGFQFMGRQFNGVTVLYAEWMELPMAGELKACPWTVDEVKRRLGW